MPFRQETIDFIDRQVSLGRPLGEVLDNIDVAKSTYFSWKKKLAKKQLDTSNLPGTRRNPLRVTPDEVALVLKTKETHPERRHRQIQGLLQNDGVYLSATTVFKILKRHGYIEPYQRRECPWKAPRYEVAKRNQIWGTDWTKIKINHETWHLLTLIDFYSRLIVAWMIVPQVKASHIRAVYSLGLSRQGIGSEDQKPRLRADRGSPNTARVTKAFFNGMGLDLLSLARVRRPTDNAITERFYQTIKQEEAYIVGSYPDERSAEEEIGGYMEFYNNERPHQGLWNFMPAEIHAVNNKSLMLAKLEALKYSARARRREYWALTEMIAMQQKMVAELQGKMVDKNDTLS